MKASGRPAVRASGVTLDLWYTLLWFRPEDRERWRAARGRVVVEALSEARRRPVSPHLAERLVHAEVRQLLAQGSKVSRLDPADLLGRLARRAPGARPAAAAEYADDLSEAGLEEAPPRTNPAAAAFLLALRRRRVPAVVLTNSARRPATWKRFLRRAGLPVLGGVVTSSELGLGKPDPRAFRVAAGRLHTVPRRTVHIGDCWHADVEGARRVGAVAVWYRGLFARYPDLGQAEFERDADDRDPAVIRAFRFPDVRRSGGIVE